MKPPRFLSVILTGLALSWAGSVFAYKPGVLREPASAIEIVASVSAPATGSIEVDFSPKGGAEALVFRVIDSAKTGVRALSYGFTNPRAVAALLRVAKRGVAASLVADYRNNAADDRSGKGRVALSALAEAGRDVHVIPAYPICHDKVLIVDRQTAELGSFNYSNAAAHVNLENVLVNWNSSALAKAYLAHFGHN